jgi:hypothetical protein
MDEVDLLLGHFAPSLSLARATGILPTNGAHC